MCDPQVAANWMDKAEKNQIIMLLLQVAQANKKLTARA